MKAELKKKIETYIKSEKIVLGELSTLPNYGTDCNCKGNIEVLTIIVGDDGISLPSSEDGLNAEKFCLNCGGSCWSHY